MRTLARRTSWMVAVAVISLLGGHRGLLAQTISVAPNTVSSTNQTIGTAGTTTPSTFWAYWNFGTSFPSSTPQTSGAQIQYSLGSTGGQLVSGSTNPSSGYTLASGTTASGSQNRGLAAAYPATISGSTSPGLNFSMQAPPSGGSEYFFNMNSVQFGSRSATTGPTQIVLRSNQDDYKQDLATAAVSANNTWQAVDMTPAVESTFIRTFSLFGVAGSGSATPNWQIDDLRVSGSLYAIAGASRGSATYGISGQGSGTFSGNFSITGTAIFNLISGGTVAVTGPVSGFLGHIQKDGAGTLVLSNANSYYGNTVIREGGVTAGSATAFGYGTVAVNNGATLDLGNYAIGNRIVTRNGATILNAGSYVGTQVVDSGTATYPQAVSGTMAVLPGAKANFDGGFTGKADLSGAAEFNSSMSGIVSLVGSGSATFADLVSGSVSLSGSAAKAFFEGLVTGTVAPSAGALSVITGTVAPTAQVSVGDGGTMQLGDGADFQQALLTNQGLLEMTNSGSTSLSSSITGTGALLVSGSGGVTSVSGSSTYTGGTEVSAGILDVDNPYGLGQGPVTVEGAGKLVLDAALQLGGTNAVTLQSGAELAMQQSGSAPVSAMLAGSSALDGVTMSGSNAATASAALLAGTASGSGGLLATEWTTVGKPASALSDILELSTPTGSSAFVLSMNYSGSAASDLWLGWNSGSNGWVNAVDGNLGANNASGGQVGYLGSFDAFQGQYGDTLTNYLGAYGRDAATNTVWAVVDHNSEFVALVTVPEPAALALAATGLGVAGAWRRRRRHQDAISPGRRRSRPRRRGGAAPAWRSPRRASGRGR